MTGSSPHISPGTALLREALQYQEDHSLEGPLFPEALDDLDRLEEQLEAAVSGLRSAIVEVEAWGPQSASSTRLREHMEAALANASYPASRQDR